MKQLVLGIMKYSIIYFIFCFSICFSQTKNEKEERIKQSEFPIVAQTYFNTISHDAKYLKFFKETDGSRKSFEVKFKINKLYYSVEFDTLGILEDIEIVIKQKHIPKSTLSNIMSYFDSNYKKTRLIKIQKQYVKYTNKSDKQFIQHIVDNPDDKHTHFEIIAEIKTKSLHELREFTFNRNGKFQRSRKVTSSSYEHALY